MNGTGTLPHHFYRFRTPALLVGVAALALCGIASLHHPDQFFQSYLFAWLFWLGITLGSLAWVMIHHMVGGGWGRAVQRIGEAAAMMLPLMFVLLLPVLIWGLPSLYPWAHPDLVAADAILKHKQPYNNTTFFVIRSVAYFFVWIVIALLVVRGSRKYDRDQSVVTARRMRKICAFGIVAYMVTGSLASFDWIMSREAHWFSTIFGFIFVIGQAFSALLFLVIVLTLLVDREPLIEYVTPGHYNDLGNLMLTCTILWAYLSFAQLLVSWTGNLQEESAYYVKRISHGYRALDVILIVFHFFVPFFMLLSKSLKRRPKLLARLAGALLVVRLVDIYWLVIPTGTPGTPSADALNPHLSFHLSNLVAPIFIGALWLPLFISQLDRRPLLALAEYENPDLADREDADRGPNQAGSGGRAADVAQPKSHGTAGATGATGTSSAANPS